MKALFDEVLQRFPELAAQVNEGDEDLPYVVVGYIAEWLLSVELDLGDDMVPLFAADSWPVALVLAAPTMFVLLGCSLYLSGSSAEFVG